MKILIAEDESLLLKLLVDKFSREGFDVTGCQNGLEAIDLYDEVQPDIVITDLQMPFSGGYELIFHIRKTRDAQTPIIVLSSTNVEDKIVSSLELGANDFVEKPFRFNELIIRVKRLLGTSV
ncbi:response regulator transcription factor [Flectobacillus longus]|uniref:response regulator transcription factor n=1 Tax=Flectobacillus longus TaxID=2984207 RepID=UPI0024B818BB|nr:response regulator transcription factor [Flectobacillus longus]MDI9881003.1 response regulator transcription factor [Flectobacillus longus]